MRTSRFLVAALAAAALVAGCASESTAPSYSEGQGFHNVSPSGATTTTTTAAEPTDTTTTGRCGEGQGWLRC